MLIIIIKGHLLFCITHLHTLWQCTNVWYMLFNRLRTPREFNSLSSLGGNPINAAGRVRVHARAPLHAWMPVSSHGEEAGEWYGIPYIYTVYDYIPVCQYLISDIWSDIWYIIYYYYCNAPTLFPQLPRATWSGVSPFLFLWLALALCCSSILKSTRLPPPTVPHT